MRMITLGDRFDPRDFYDRLKKSTVEFIVIFSGILLSFYMLNNLGLCLKAVPIEFKI